ncbi:MAG: NIPSNAP family protein [Steroidobacteraceae bacterium]|nr:NIPSNAP family protein [Steroidobacteraceae bacterium]
MRILLLLLSCFPAYAGAADAFDCPANGARLQQLRIYELSRENRDAFHERFRDHALRIMKKYGFNVVDLWESDTGEKLQLIYVLEWPDKETMDAAWKVFLADAEWIEIKKQSAALHGQFVREAKGQPLERLSYSPACKGK